MTRETTTRALGHALLFVAGLALASMLLMWSWNTLGHDLFGGPEAQFRHGVAAAVLCAIALAAVRAGARRRTTTSSSREQSR
jgi:hypothetical protein